MKIKQAGIPDANQLRKQAEARLSVQNKKGTETSRSVEDSLRLVHELEVHQIELEIQNEELKQTRAELEAALDQFTDLYDFAPVGYFTLGRDGVIQRANLAGAILLGVERIRLVQKRLAAFVPAESYIVFGAFLQEVFSGVNKETCEIAFLKEGGQKIWMQLDGLRIERSETCRIAAMDITKRKQAEMEQAKLAAIVASSEDAIVGKTLDGVITSWNAGAKKLYGYTEQEVVGQSVAILVPKDHPDELPDLLAKIRRGESVEHFETVRIRKDGVRLNVSVSVSPIFDEVGRVAAASSISRDVTDRKQAEEKLRESEARFRAISESANDAIISVDEAGNIVDWNLGAKKMFGYPENEAQGQPLALILPNRYLEVHQTAMERVQAGGEKRIIGKTIEREGRRKDNSEFPLEISVSEWQVNNKNFYSAIIRDITERKQADDMINQYANELEIRVEERTTELVRANHVKDEFLANMSHELRTPLNSILGFSETLLEGTRGSMTDRQTEALEYISSSGRHLLGLINDILDLSKIEANKFEIRPEIAVVNDICMSSLSFIRQLAQKKMIDVEYIRQSEVDLIYADPKRLKQILINLLNNAVKFTPERGKVKLEVQADSPQGMLQFIVSDSGIGIDPADMGKLFKPFVQLDSSLSRHYDGSGLGLVLVKSLVELHGGRIEVESDAGNGCRFIISLPWSPQEPAPQAVDHPLEVDWQAKIGTSEKFFNGKQSILLADDNEVSLMMLKEYLEHFGYHVTEARDGAEVLDEVYRNRPNLILMDIQMPNLDGMEAILRLRADPNFESVPIVAVTALAMPGDRERLLIAGANEYISKPFRLQEMMKIVKSFLNPAPS